MRYGAAIQNMRETAEVRGYHTQPRTGPQPVWRRHAPFDSQCAQIGSAAPDRPQLGPAISYRSQIMRSASHLSPSLSLSLSLSDSLSLSLSISLSHTHTLSQFLSFSIYLSLSLRVRSISVATPARPRSHSGINFHEPSGHSNRTSRGRGGGWARRAPHVRGQGRGM
eukprot:sb/3472436/